MIRGTMIVNPEGGGGGGAGGFTGCELYFQLSEGVTIKVIVL